MQSYIEMILDELPGDTPKQQYEKLKELQKEKIALYSKVEQAKTLCRGLLDTPSLSDIHTIVKANLETLERQD